MFSDVTQVGRFEKEEDGEVDKLQWEKQTKQAIREEVKAECGGVRFSSPTAKTGLGFLDLQILPSGALNNPSFNLSGVLHLTGYCGYVTVSTNRNNDENHFPLMTHLHLINTLCCSLLRGGQPIGSFSPGALVIHSRILMQLINSGPKLCIPIF